MDKLFMREAFFEAKKAFDINEVPVGAVIVKDGEIIARGHNTRENNADPLGHAEINAIVQASKKLGRWRLSDCEIYVTLEPCPMCAGAILQAKMKRVIFGGYDEKFGSVGSKFNLYYDHKFNHDVLFTGGVMEKECTDILRDFFEKKR